MDGNNISGTDFNRMPPSVELELFRIKAELLLEIESKVRKPLDIDTPLETMVAEALYHDIPVSIKVGE